MKRGLRSVSRGMVAYADCERERQRLMKYTNAQYEIKGEWLVHEKAIV